MDLLTGTTGNALRHNNNQHEDLTYRREFSLVWLV